MNVSSPRAKELFQAAKADAPSHAERDAMWTSIETATASAMSVSTLTVAAKSAGIASSKLALGIALGASLTVGIAGTVVMLVRGAPSSVTTSHVTQPRSLDRADEADQAESVRQPLAPIVITGRVAPTDPTDNPRTEDVATAAAHGGTTPAMSEQDRLAREARMVSEARGALHRGEPEVALRIVRAARHLQGARLVPEELTVEAQALRAMGDEAGANRALAELAGKFPEQALAH